MGKFIDLTGNKYGKLTVLYRTTNYKKKTMWHCKCECGNECDVDGGSLKNNNTKSCGCLHQQILKQHNIEQSELNKIKLGTKFGKLTVIEDLGIRKATENSKKGRRYYKCKCDCGNITIGTGLQLKSGNKQSCGCLTSIGESKIAKILSQNNIRYITQYHFNDFYGTDGINKSYYRFDFGIIDDNNNLKYLIEFDGRQHFTGPESKWRDCSSLEEIQKNDKKKNEYALKHNIPLIRIPYFIYQNLTINDLKLETSEFLVKEEE